MQTAITVVTAMVDMHAMMDAVTTPDIKPIFYSATAMCITTHARLHMYYKIVAIQW